MRVARCSVWVREEAELREQSFVRESGEPWAWLDLGADREVSVYGSPAAMRRLGAAVIAAADVADGLPEGRGPAHVGLRPAA
jgi:hypothetical protein